MQRRGASRRWRHARRAQHIGRPQGLTQFVDGFQHGMDDQIVAGQSARPGRKSPWSKMPKRFNFCIIETFLEKPPTQPPILQLRRIHQLGGLLRKPILDRCAHGAATFPRSQFRKDATDGEAKSAAIVEIVRRRRHRHGPKGFRASRRWKLEPGNGAKNRQLYRCGVAARSRHFLVNLLLDKK